MSIRPYQLCACFDLSLTSLSGRQKYSYSQNSKLKSMTHVRFDAPLKQTIDDFTPFNGHPFQRSNQLTGTVQRGFDNAGLRVN